MKDNFECKSCSFCFFVPQYSISLNKSQPAYTTKFGVVCCPECKSAEIISIPNEGICSNIGDFSSASAEDKKIMLQKRAKRAMRKDAEQRHEIETKFYGKVNEKYY